MTTPHDNYITQALLAWHVMLSRRLLWQIFTEAAENNNKYEALTSSHTPLTHSLSLTLLLTWQVISDEAVQCFAWLTIQSVVLYVFGYKINKSLNYALTSVSTAYLPTNNVLCSIVCTQCQQTIFKSPGYCSVPGRLESNGLWRTDWILNVLLISSENLLYLRSYKPENK